MTKKDEITFSSNDSDTQRAMIMPKCSRVLTSTGASSHLERGNFPQVFAKQ